MPKIIENFEKFNEIKVFVFRWKGIPSHSIYKSGLNRKKTSHFFLSFKKKKVDIVKQNSKNLLKNF